MERIPQAAQQAVEQARAFASQAAETAQTHSHELMDKASELSANVSEGARQFLHGVGERFKRVRGEAPALPTDSLPLPTVEDAPQGHRVARRVAEKTGVAATAARKGVKAAVEKSPERVKSAVNKSGELAQGASERVKIVFGATKDRLADVTSTVVAKTPDKVKTTAKKVGEYYTDSEKGTQRKVALGVAVGAAAVATAVVVAKKRRGNNTSPTEQLPTPEPPKPVPAPAKAPEKPQLHTTDALSTFVEPQPVSRALAEHYVHTQLQGYNNESQQAVLASLKELGSGISRAVAQSKSARIGKANIDGKKYDVVEVPAHYDPTTGQIVTVGNPKAAPKNAKSIKLKVAVSDLEGLHSEGDKFDGHLRILSTSAGDKETPIPQAGEAKSAIGLTGALFNQVHNTYRYADRRTFPANGKAVRTTATITQKAQDRWDSRFAGTKPAPVIARPDKATTPVDDEEQKRQARARRAAQRLGRTVTSRVVPATAGTPAGLSINQIMRRIAQGDAASTSTTPSKKKRR